MFSYTLLNHPDSFSPNIANIDAILVWIEKEVPIVQLGIINIAFLSDDEIQILNKQYRWIDSTTDVLSFHYFDDFTQLSEMEIAGEIILSESKILTQAAEHSHTPEKETEILVLHGILHILGFDHETDEDYVLMWKHEEHLRSSLDLNQINTKNL